MGTLFYGALILGGIILFLFIAFVVMMYWIFPGTPRK